MATFVLYVYELKLKSATQQSSGNFRLISHFRICNFLFHFCHDFAHWSQSLLYQAQVWVSHRDNGSDCMGLPLWLRGEVSVVSRFCPPLFEGKMGNESSDCYVSPAAKSPPKNTKLLSNSWSSLNYLTHYYIIPTGYAPDSTWLPANSLSVCLFFFFFSTTHRCKHFLQFFLQPLCISLPDGHCFCPISDSLSVLLARLTGYLLFMPLLTSCMPVERQMDVCNTRFSAEWWIVCLSK